VRTSIAAVAVVGVLLVACSPPDLTPDDGEGAADPGVAERPEPDDPSAGDPFADVPDVPAPEPDVPGSPGSPGDRAMAPPTTCDLGDLAAMDEVIAGQLAAFAADDWEAALGFASDEFRAGMDPDTFAALIEDGYPVAADAAEHRSAACVTRDGGAAEVRVEVVATDGETAAMVYLLVDEGGWAIAGAVHLEADDPDTTTV
jgi:hypothetical protein